MRLLARVTLALLLACSACTSPAPASTSTPIGPSGGTVSSGGVVLDVPSGALSSQQTLSIATSSDAVPTGYEAFSPLYRFGPDGLTFASPVMIRIPFTGDASRATIFWTSASGTGFDALPTTVEGDVALAQVTHFSEGFVGALLCSPGCGGTSGGTCHCTETCGGHTTAVVCDGTTCQCSLDGANTTSFAQGAACGGPNTLEPLFVSQCGAAPTPDAGVSEDAATSTCSPACGGSSGGNCSCMETCGGHVTTMTCDATSCQCAVDGANTTSFSSAGVCAMGSGVGGVFASMCGAMASDAGAPDAGTDAGAAACGTTTPGCGGGASGCNCTDTCGGHTYAMTCDATSCQCTTDGANTTSFAAGTTCMPAQTSADFLAHCEG